MALGEDITRNEKIIPEGAGKNAADTGFGTFEKEGMVFDNVSYINSVATLIGGEMKIIPTENIKAGGEKKNYRD